MELIYGAQFLPVFPGWTFTAHQHHGLEVVGVVQGQVQLLTTEQRYTIQAGQVVTIPPHLSHGWSTDVCSQLNVLHLIYVPHDLVLRLVPGAQPRHLTLSSPQFAEYDALFSRVAALDKHTSPQQMRLLRAYLEAFLLTLLDGDGEQDSSLTTISEVVSYLQMHLDEPVTVAHLAQRFLMSEVTLRRRFHAAFGISPKQYVLEMRLGEAQHLLATTELAIREIARQTGFFDLAHFSSTFRQRFGLAPSEWREKERL